MIFYIFLGIAAVLLAFQFAIEKKNQLSEGTDTVPSLRYNMFYGLFTAIFFFCINGFRIELSTFSVLCAFAFSVACLLYTLIGFRIMKSGNLSLYTLFLMSGGMIVPYLFGVAFLNEELTVLRVLGLMVMTAAITISGGIKTEGAKSILPLCIIVFFLNGTVSILSKCHAIDTVHHAVDCRQFVMLTGLGRFLVSGIGLLFCKPTKQTLRFSCRLMPTLIAIAGAVGGVSYMLQLVGAAHLPATVTYPLITGGCIIFSALSDVVFYKEKLTRQQLTGILLSFVGTFFFL